MARSKTDSEASEFDGYHRWLGIPKQEQPANHYRLLGISLFEDDPDVIDIAASARVTTLRQQQSGPHGVQCTQILNQVARARRCLLNEGHKAEYDEQLRAEVFPNAEAESSHVFAASDLDFSVSAPSQRGSLRIAGVFAGVALGGLTVCFLLWQFNLFPLGRAQQRVRNQAENPPQSRGLQKDGLGETAAKPESTSHREDVVQKPVRADQEVVGKQFTNTARQSVASGEGIERPGESNVRPSLALRSEETAALPTTALNEVTAPPASMTSSDSELAEKKTGATRDDRIRLTKPTLQYGFKWLSRQQQVDGSWSFIHGPNDPGSLNNRMGATGLALLAYLGGGHTHKAGEYRTEIRKGIEFVISQMKVTGAGADLRGNSGDMYTQGINTITLCEAYRITKDNKLRQPAQLAVNFIVNAQDPKGGGWRYQPGQTGDTSVVGWQIAALTSAKAAKLQVPVKTLKKASSFLNVVQSNSGANYGYDKPGAGPATTAIGLLCRFRIDGMDNRAAYSKGLEFLGKTGPQPGNIYFDFYATQALHYFGGTDWTTWQNVMFVYLRGSQVLQGDAAGSWKPLGTGDLGDEAGGRHYRTCMSLMTLGVEHRHLSIYGRSAKAE